MKAADRCVRIHARRRAVAVDELKKSFDVVAQLLGRDSSVLDEGEGLGVVFHGHRKAKRGFAQAPDSRLSRQIERVVKAVPEAALA